MAHKRRNAISEQWSPRTRSMLESPAYRALSLSAHRLISRVELELCYHGGTQNGRLPLTYADLVEYGIERAAIAPAIREAEALGFIRVTERGRGGNREYRKPNLFALTFAYCDRQNPPTNEWAKIKTADEASAIARAARANKSPTAVSHGRRHAAKKQKTGVGKSRVSVRETRTENRRAPVWDSHTTERVQQPALQSISREGERSDTPGLPDDGVPDRKVA